ncbi:energy transducer TonB family protein [Stakelama marina]|uniref:Energy transducer TonB n=1 Tax=Stakelama marina TaxID=2826939 RepID=A0A8T4IGU2_9SPHN|nr:energy transducer TonB [Stakelama marina]MBR0553817.1 energy transducer TonB [Stakelama marina]
MKTITTFAIASGLLLAVPGHAQNTQNPEFDVTAPTLTIERWSKGITRKLNRNLDYPVRFHQAGGFHQPSEGVVRVNFRCTETGAPTAITLAKSSGHRELDRAAMAAVQRIKTLHPLPAGIGAGQRYQALLLFALDQQSHDRQLAKLQQEADRRNAALGQPAERVAMGISIVPDA